MTKIEIPDDIAPMLEAKAAAEGLTLIEWIQKLPTGVLLHLRKLLVYDRLPQHASR